MAVRKQVKFDPRAISATAYQLASSVMTFIFAALFNEFVTCFAV